MIRVRMLNGYRVVYMPSHVSAMTSSNWKGWVYEHIVVAEDMMGRRLSSDEVVHHLNMIRDDNRPDNLLVMTRSQHTKLHSWINAGAPGVKTSGKNGVNSGKAKVKVPSHCKICDAVLTRRQKKFCSAECYSIGRRTVERPDKETLEKEIGMMSFVALGKKYGVSDNAVRKWARSYGIRLR